MRRTILIAGLIALISAPVFAQTDERALPSKNGITMGRFAQLVLDIALRYEEATPDPVTALERLKTLGIAPATWEAGTRLTHQDLQDTCQRVGIEYLAAKPDAPVSEAFVTALLWREVGKLRDYAARRLGHGLSANHVLDAGVDRAVIPQGQGGVVSPSDFE